MREYEYIFREGFLRGLRRDSSNPRNTQALVQAVNFEIAEMGIIPISLPTQWEPQDILWPLPQIFYGKVDSIMLAAETDSMGGKIYKIVHGTPWSVTVVATYAGLGETSIDHQADFLDFGKFALIVCEEFIYKRNPSTGAWTEVTASATMPIFHTACALGGVVFGGNIQGSWYDCGANHVVYSKVNNLDFTPGRGEAGYVEMPFPGSVLRLKQLEGSVIVYGTNGVARIRIDPELLLPSVEVIAPIGISDRGFVGGNTFKHLAVMATGELFIITSKEIQRIGYKEFFSALEDINITYDEVNDVFYISDGESTFVLTQYGLSQTDVVLTTGMNYFTEFRACYTDPGDEALIVTDTIDFGQPGLKSLETIELKGSWSNTVEVAVSYRLSYSDSFATTEYMPVNAQGVCYCKITAKEFRIHIRETKLTAFSLDLDEMIIRWKMTDKRNIRGQYDANLADNKSGR